MWRLFWLFFIPLPVRLLVKMCQRTPRRFPMGWWCVLPVVFLPYCVCVHSFRTQLCTYCSKALVFAPAEKRLNHDVLSNARATATDGWLMGGWWQGKQKKENTKNKTHKHVLTWFKLLSLLERSWQLANDVRMVSILSLSFQRSSVFCVALVFFLFIAPSDRHSYLQRAAMQTIFPTAKFAMPCFVLSFHPPRVSTIRKCIVGVLSLLERP